jgi:hypothetical protein
MMKKWQRYVVFVFVLCVGLAWGSGVVLAAPKKKAVQPSIQQVSSWFRSWTLDCKQFAGVLRKARRIQGFPVKVGTRVVLSVKRGPGFWLGEICPRVRDNAQCVQCDRCALACRKRKLWTNPVVGWRVVKLVLGKRHQVDGIWFAPGTTLQLKANGRIARATLAKSQPLRAKMTGVSLPFPKGLTIEFEKWMKPDPQLSIPEYKLFDLGRFKCYYRDKYLGVVCHF